MILLVWGFIWNHKNLTDQGDIRDINKISEIKEDIDVAIHLACISNDNTFNLTLN